MMDVVWPKQFKLNRFETGLSASVNGAIGLASFNQEISWKLSVFHPSWKCLPTCGCMILRHPCVQDLIHC